MPQWHRIWPIMLICSDDKWNFSSSLTTFTSECVWWLCRIWSIYPGLWRMMIVRWLYFTPPRPLAECNVAVNVKSSPELAHFPTEIPEAPYHPLKHRRDPSKQVFNDHFWNMSDTCLKHVYWVIYTKKLFNTNRLEAHYPLYHHTLMMVWLLAHSILPPAGLNQPKLSRFNFNWCTSIASGELVK